MKLKKCRKSKGRVLWIAPKLNHYRIGLLSRLSTQLGFLRIAAGDVESLAEQKILSSENPLFIDRLHCSKNRFAWKLETYKRLRMLIKDDDVGTVVMPLEKKFLPLILFLCILRFTQKFQLVTYNHPFFWEGELSFQKLRLTGLKLCFSLYDKVVFYSEASRDHVVGLAAVNPSKAFFANNTLATEELNASRSFSVNTRSPINILYIGKLSYRKRLDLLFESFDELKNHIPDSCLTIIGDGPDRELVQARSDGRADIDWIGETSSEEEISGFMEATHVVFVPGWSGLSIVHSFGYSKPYVTFESSKGFSPELAYLEDEVNGLVLEDDIGHGMARLAGLLSNPKKYERVCRGAYEMAAKLSSNNWCRQIVLAIEAESKGSS